MSRWPLPGLVALAAALPWVGAHAQMDPLLRQQLTGFEQVGPNEYRRITTPTIASTGTRAITPVGGGALVADAVTLPGKGGPLAITAKAQIGRSTALLGGALALKALPVVGTGILLWEVWDAIRVTPKGDGDGLLHDPGVNPTTVQQDAWVCGEAPYQGTGLTAVAACGDWMAKKNAAAVWVNTSGVACRSKNTLIPSTSQVPTGAWIPYGTMVDAELNDGYGGPCNDYVIDYSGANIASFLGSQPYDKCPASIDPLNPAYSIPEGMPPDDDGKCRQARYHHSPITPEGAAALPSTADIPDSLIPEIVRDVLNRGVPLQPDSRSSDGPATQPGQPVTSTKVNPDGSTTVTTSTPTHNYNYGGDTITVTSTTVTTINNDGDVTTITEDGDPTAAPEIITCGLPNTPKCKMDETGTPESVDPMADPAAALEPLTGTPAPVDSAWSWSFSLPSGCSAISLGEFGGHSLSFDLCEYQPVVHDIMTVLWLMSTVILCAGMVLRTFQGA